MGAFIDIGGCKLNVCDSGSGSPAVVLDAGAGAGAASWSLVQPELAKLTRTWSYDRAGIGSSESTTAPRAGDHVVDELRRALDAAGVAPPYVMVGHSHGCFHVRLFAATYPERVAGLVLVEPSHEDASARLPEAYQQARVRRQRALAGLERKLPTLRLFARLPIMPRWARLSIRAMSARDLATGNAERAALDQTFAQLRARAGSHGDLPLIVLAAERSVACFEPRDYPRDGAGAVRAAWRELLAELAARSSRGELRGVPDCGHLVPLERPTAVVDAVRDLLRLRLSARAASPDR